MKYNSIKNLFVVLFGCLVLSSVARGEIKLVQTINQAPRPITPEDYFSIKLSVDFVNETMPSNIKVSEIKPPKGLQFIEKSQRRSSKFSNINGVTTQTESLEFIYYIQAKKVGTFIIPGLSYKKGTQIHRAKNTKIIVMPPGSKVAPVQRPKDSGQGGGLRSLFDQFFGTDSGFDQFQVFDGLSRDPELYVDLKASNRKPYVGEQILLRWDLWVDGRLLNMDILKFPKLEGFWKEEVSRPLRFQFQQKIRNNKNLLTSPIFVYALTALSPGVKTIDDVEVGAKVVKGSFFSNSKSLRRKSKSIEIEVQELPQPQPEDYNFAVGKYKATAVFPSKQIKQGEGFVVKYVIAGEGQLRFMEKSSFEISKDVKVYDIQEEYAFSKNLQSRKVYSVTYVPQADQTIEIPAQSFTFFNPDAEEYYTVKTNSRSFSVAKNPGFKAQADDEGLSGLADQPWAPKAKSALPWSWSVIPVLNIMSFLLFFAGLIFVLWAWYKRKSDGNVLSLEDRMKEKFLEIHSALDQGQSHLAAQKSTSTIYYFLNAIRRKSDPKADFESLLNQAPASLRLKLGGILSQLNDEIQTSSYSGQSRVESKNIEKLVQSLEALVKEYLS